MDEYTATIEADSREEALNEAASVLGVPTDNMYLVEAGNGVFMASVKDLDAEIKISVSDDNMKAMVQSAHGHLGEGKPFGEELLIQALSRLEITAPILDGVVENIRNNLKAAMDVEGVMVAQGIDPIDGWDGELKLLVQTDMFAGTEDEYDRVDYHERGFVATVKAGEVLGAITLPTEGRPGTDVFGNPVTARSGKDVLFEAGENVVVDKNGEIRAEKGGMIRYVHGVLSITEVFEHAGDVDFHTGNIHMDTGSITIRGTVHPGFEVNASGNVVIGKTIKEATVRSGGDIELKQGVIESTVEAEGAVYARFAQNATIKAGGDVIVANNLHNCHVMAGDNVVVTTGKGIVRGGTMRCAKKFEAKEIGSSSEVETIIELGRRTKDEDQIIADRAHVNDAIVEINRFLGCEDGIPDLSGKSEKERDGIAKVLETLKELHAQRTSLSSLLAAKTKERLQCCAFQVIAKNIVYPGTQVSILGRVFLVKQPLSKCVFLYDPEKDKVVVESL